MYQIINWFLLGHTFTRLWTRGAPSGTAHQESSFR